MEFELHGFGTVDTTGKMLLSSGVGCYKDLITSKGSFGKPKARQPFLRWGGWVDVDRKSPYLEYFVWIPSSFRLPSVKAQRLSVGNGEA